MKENIKMTAYDILKEKELMQRAVIAASVNGETAELTAEVAQGADVAPLTFDDAEGKKVFWHTASHILAQAVKNLYPEAKLTIGPSTDKGFYYDIDREKPFTNDEIGRAYVPNQIG